MAYTDPMPGSLKRKRRRRPDVAPLSARLQLVDNLSGDAAEVSRDLVKDLRLTNASSSDGPLYIAIKEWTPANPPTAIAPKWTIIPCRSAKQEADNPHSLVRVSTRSHLVQALINNLKLSPPPRSRGPAPALEIRVTDVVPLVLETIYVSIDSEALSKHDQVQKKYAGGFVTKKKSAKHLTVRAQDHAQVNGASETRSEEELKQLVRQSISKSSVVHAGEMYQLALPSHPVTHAPPPPCTITACDPVSQGLLTEATRVVIVTSDKIPESRAKAAQSPTIPFPSEQLSEVEEDTSNEAFYTAAEDGNASSAPATPGKKSASFDLSDTEDETDGNLSDDPEGMISLTSPALGSQTSGMLSSMTAATPRPFGKHMTGVHTPGSVFSSMTAATLRGGHATRSKVLRTQGLLEKIPDELLYPKPLSHEDEEARIYVDTTVLARLGCFSGDWVEVSEADDPARTGIASLGMSSFLNRDDEESANFRAVKVFGLPEMLSNKNAGQYKVQGRGRSESFSSHLGITVTPAAYLSPILLANLGDPTFLRMTPMRSSEEPCMGRPAGKMPPASLPPAAKDANLLKIQSPVSTDKAIDSSVFNGLVAYFEGKQRLVKTGDLIAIPVDEDVGRAIYDGSSAEDGASNDILSFFGPTKDVIGKGSTKVVWFQVGSVASHSNEDREQPDAWNGLVSMVPSKTKMHQSGTEQRKIPQAIASTWPYYEGMLSAAQTQNTKSSPLSTTPSPPPSILQRRLRELISTATSPRAIHLGLPPMAILLHSTQRNIGKSHVAKQTCLDLGMHCFPLDAFDILTEAASGGGDNNTVGLFESRAERALQCGAEHTCILIQHIEALSSDRMYTAIKDVISDSRIIVATTTDLDKVPENLRGLFTHELEMSAPDEAERETILQSIIASTSVSVSPAVDLAAIAVKTAALVAGDLMDVVDRAISARTTRLEELASKASSDSSAVTVRDITISGGDSALNLIPSDFDTAVDLARKNFADSIGAPKIPNVQWSDVGGLANVKEAVIETIQLPLSRPELFAKGLKKRSGILFYGPPGTGKTLLAKAIATEFSLNFFSVKGPELLNMYIGESEANVRRVFQRARDARPCVVFFDELDSVAPKRGNQGDSGGVMDRIVSQLLAELDGMSDGGGEEGGGAGVFVIGATNRPDLLDQALLRPGRFDKMLYLGVSDTHEKQAKILEALTRKFTLSPTLSLPQIASSLPFTYTGADLYALCSDAMLKAVTRSARLVDFKIASINADRAASAKQAITVAQFFDHHATEADLDVLVTPEDFLEANSELVPSVSSEELGHYERVRREFEGGRKEDKDGQGQRQGPAQGQNRKPTLEEAEAWQARRIEEMIRSGMGDGSLAKGGDGKGKGKGRMMAFGGSPALNGHGSPDPSEDGGRAQSRDSTVTDETDEGDFVIRTGQMDLNGNGSGGTNGNGNGGGRVRERESRFFGRDREKGKGKEKRAKSRTMGQLFGKGKGKGREEEGETGERDGKREGEFGEAASDKGLYD
ncbi:peroxisomal biogenesis factor 6 [Elsinoe australis]|uniref:Peroxisomal ATPase PEX6 n=1 Tax=Elsinoe australis TaxID=40998 RepID=A0A4U7AW52_9PEZI|nr:peroxisomal biogenesis factor 6 [Elsinoe australis]